MLRAAIAQQLRQWTFEILAWNLADSQSYRAFCRLGAFDHAPKKSTLQENIRKVGDQAWDAIHQILIKAARDEGLEKGRKVRIDCTATKADIAPPSDSKLCVDVIRVGNRLLERLPEEIAITWSNHHRRAKKRASAIRHTPKKTRRKKLYQDLLTVMNKHIGYLICAVEAFSDYQKSPSSPANETTPSDLISLIAKAQQVIDQSTRRVIDGEKVPANEKIVSIFEKHTDILTKRGGTVYGHKICMTVGASSLVLDVTVEEGNPADSTLATKMIERQKDLYGLVPRQAAFDGGFASKANLQALKEMGVTDVAFNKKRGLKISDMVRSRPRPLLVTRAVPRVQDPGYRSLRALRAKGGAGGCKTHRAHRFGGNPVGDEDGWVFVRIHDGRLFDIRNTRWSVLGADVWTELEAEPEISVACPARWAGSSFVTAWQVVQDSCNIGFSG